MAEVPPPRPQLRIVRGQPTAEELAVLTAVVTAAGGGNSDEPAPRARGRWNDPAGQHRRPWLTGVGAWRAAVR
jgi:hypothetical protein